MRWSVRGFLIPRIGTQEFVLENRNIEHRHGIVFVQQPSFGTSSYHLPAMNMPKQWRVAGSTAAWAGRYFEIWLATFAMIFGDTVPVEILHHPVVRHDVHFAVGEDYRHEKIVLFAAGMGRIRLFPQLLSPGSPQRSGGGHRRRRVREPGKKGCQRLDPLLVPDYP